MNHDVFFACFSISYLSVLLWWGENAMKWVCRRPDLKPCHFLSTIISGRRLTVVRAGWAALIVRDSWLSALPKPVKKRLPGQLMLERRQRSQNLPLLDTLSLPIGLRMSRPSLAEPRSRGAALPIQADLTTAPGFITGCSKMSAFIPVCGVGGFFYYLWPLKGFANYTVHVYMYMCVYVRIHGINVHTVHSMMHMCPYILAYFVRNIMTTNTFLFYLFMLFFIQNALKLVQFFVAVLLLKANCQQMFLLQAPASVWLLIWATLYKQAATLCPIWKIFCVSVKL